MSGVLNHKKKIVAYLVFIVAIAIFTAVYVSLHLNYIVLFVIYLFVITVICLNEVVRKKIWRMHDPFDTFSNIRNVEYLLIGDQCDPSIFVPDGKTYVQIKAPGRGFNSAYQILRHTHSILMEDCGTVILACSRNAKEFSIFDIPFLHPITIKKYHLEKLKMRSNFPILFSPIASIQFLYGKDSHKYEETINIDPELIEFCKQRSYSLHCYIKQ